MSKTHTLRAALALSLTAAAFMGTLAVAAGLDSGSVWPMFHRGASHSGRSWIPTTPVPTVHWSTALSDTVEYSSPVMDRYGTLFLGDQGKELWAVNAAGIPLWNYHTNGNIRYSTPAIADDGTIYVGSADNLLYAIYPQGFLRWASATNGAVKTAPAIAPDGTIYVGSDDGCLWAFNPDGTVKWSYATGDTVRSSPAIGVDGTVYFGSNDGRIYAVYPTGTLRWSGATGGPVKGGPAIGRSGEIIIGSSDGYLYSISPDGSLNWATYTGQNLRTTPAIGVYGRIYIGMDTSIAAFHSTGEPSWTYDTGARVYSSPSVRTAADSTDVVFCGSDNGSVYAVRAGILVWAANLANGPVRSSPSIGPHGHIFVGTMGGRLFSIGQEDPTSAPQADAGAAAPHLVLSPNPSSGGPVHIRPGALSNLSGAGGGGDRAGTLRIFDPAGRVVLTRALAGGTELVWDGRDAGGQRLPAGVYQVRWSGRNLSAAERLVVVR